MTDNFLGYLPLNEILPMHRIYKTLHSSKAAIDLASIMVGVIIIGLIGGVIAATVFAVIPWSQDKAAKQQLDSIHTAQNAAYGLSSDAQAAASSGMTPNSFQSSADLAKYNLLSTGANYCTIPSTDKKNYTGYSLSSSGSIWAATNDSKIPKRVPSIPAGDCAWLNDLATSGSNTPAGPTPGTAPVVLNPTDGFGTWNKDSSVANACTVSTSSAGLLMDITDSRDGCKLLQSFDTLPGKTYTIDVVSLADRGFIFGGGSDAGNLIVGTDVSTAVKSTNFQRGGLPKTTSLTFVATKDKTVVSLRSISGVTNMNLPYKHTLSSIKLTPAA
jgi:type II secretory pathway pseudopilin PulG